MNPLLGVFFHWLGGLSSASFYVPYKRIRRWSWEIFWLTGGVFSWVIAPWIFAGLRTNDLLGVLGATPDKTLLWCWFWGAMWGFGGLTFGLTMRYLGLSLGMAVALGLTTVIGTMGLANSSVGPVPQPMRTAASRPCSATTCSRHWAGRCGTSSSSSTRWAKARWALRLLELDAAHGIDHPVFDAVGIRAQGMGRRQRPHAHARLDRHRRTDRVDGRHRNW